MRKSERRMIMVLNINSEQWLDTKDLPNEEWKDIELYENLYQVSNYGRIKSLSLRNRQCFIKREKILSQSKDKDGYLYVRKEDNKIVGIIQIRHRFNEFLEKYAGHIGYCVCPSERRKGYATQMLSLVLPECERLGIYDVLVCCLADNEASRRTILDNGGVYESKVFEPDSRSWIERYWIHL